jgi:hypothetical protein
MISKDDDDDNTSFFVTGRPRTDRSKVTIVLQQPTTNNGSDDNPHNKFISLHVDPNELDEFLKTQRRIVQTSKHNARKQTQQILHDHLATAMKDCSTNIKQFANWYFAYTTTYKLLSVAMQSATSHVLKFGKDETTLKEAVTYDVQKYICNKYQALVLRPALTDPKIHRSIVTTLKSIYQEVYLRSLTELDDSVQTFVRQHTTYDDGSNKSSSSGSLSISPDSIVLELDWKAQLQKAQHLPVAYEKNPPEFSVALVGTGAIAGKAMGGTAIKAMSAKLATPFATKAAATAVSGKAAAAAAGASTAGAAGGMVAGGPLGAGIGAAIGIGIDMAMNAGVSLIQRDAFEKDVQESLDATLLEWEERILPEVDRIVQDVWFAGAEDALMYTGNDEANGDNNDAKKENP